MHKVGFRPIDYLPDLQEVQANANISLSFRHSLNHVSTALDKKFNETLQYFNLNILHERGIPYFTYIVLTSLKLFFW
jgi:hypothetical protein